MLLFATVVNSAESDATAKIRFDIVAESIETALAAFSRQSGINIVIEADVSKRATPAALNDSYTVDEALRRLLGSLGLKAERLDSTTIVIRDESAAATSVADAAPEKDTLLPQILVSGHRRSLNVDVARSADGVQPYVVFDREDIENAQVENLEQFLRSRLAMDTEQRSRAQNSGQSDNSARTISSFNLRGLGSNQTLVLIDGRRVAGVGIGGETANQPDLNGIPMSAVERIEVLPSTAGGIYGGGATGGVINVILRRDYSGVEATVGYGNVFKGNAATKRIDLSGSFTLNEGRTHLTAVLSHSEQTGLLQGDRDFTRRAAALKERNNPTVSADDPSPPTGATPNIRSTDGSPLVLDNGKALGSNFTHVPRGYAGAPSDNGQALLDNAGRYNLELPNDLHGLKRGLMAVPTVDSLMASVRHEFTPSTIAFVDVSASRNRGRSPGSTDPVGRVIGLPADAPNNPFQQDINISFASPQLNSMEESSTEQQRATVGVIVKLPANWRASADYAWSRTRQTETQTMFALDAGAIYGLEFHSPIDPVPRGTLGTGLPGAPLPGQSAARPALDALQEQSTFPLDYSPYLMPSPNTRSREAVSIGSATLRLGGPAWELPAGPIMVSALIERRKQEAADAVFGRIDYVTRLPMYQVRPRTWQSVNSSYAEVNAPLFSSESETSGSRTLDLQLSARRDQYDTTGTSDWFLDLPSPDASHPPVNYQHSSTTSTAYTAGLRFQPVESLATRASVGTGFLPPDVNQLSPTTQRLPFSFGFLDRRRPLRDANGNVVGYDEVGSSSLWDYISGGNPNLKPERSRSVSAGIVFTPASVPGLRFSVDHTRITKIKEISDPDAQFILDNEALYPGRVVRGPKLPTDPADWAGPVTVLDSSKVNIAHSRVETFDFNIDYAFETSVGDFRVSSVVTRQTHLQRQLVTGSGVVELVDTDAGPLAWRGNLGLNWQRGPLMLGWDVQYYHSYRVCGATEPEDQCAVAVRNQGSDRIPRQIYHDLQARYQFGAQSGSLGSLLSEGEISLGIQNVFNTSPPIVVDHATPNEPNIGYSTFGDPRLRRYTVTFKKSFK